jgi:hypothetical protein
MQLARDISDVRRLKTDLTEQAFRDLDNQVTSVFIFAWIDYPADCRQDRGRDARVALPGAC